MVGISTDTGAESEAAVTTSRIYTKLGDDGSTGLLFGGRTSKADPLIDAVGSIDEAVSTLGLARAMTDDEALAGDIMKIQRGLFAAAADVVANPRTRDRLVPDVSLVTPQMVAALEGQIDQIVTEHPLRPVFVVPGANRTSAALDMARATVRRAERRLVAHRGDVDQDGPGNPQALAYLNRVSDLLYVLARVSAGDEEPVSHT